MPTTMVQAGAAFVPWASLDLDEKTRTQGTPSARVDDGEGWMIRTGSYDDALGVEFVLQTTEHDETAAGSSLRTLAGYADLTQRFELWDGPISAWTGVGLAKPDTTFIRSSPNDGRAHSKLVIGLRAAPCTATLSASRYLATSAGETPAQSACSL